MKYLEGNNIKLIFFILLVQKAGCDVMEELLASVKTLNNKIDIVRLELAITNTKVDQIQNEIQTLGEKIDETKGTLQIRTNAIETRIDYFELELEDLGFYNKPLRAYSKLIPKKYGDQDKINEDEREGKLISIFSTIMKGAANEECLLFVYF